MLSMLYKYILIFVIEILLTASALQIVYEIAYFKLAMLSELTKSKCMFMYIYFLIIISKSASHADKTFLCFWSRHPVARVVFQCSASRGRQNK